jgi:hypothetical protein
VTEEFTEMQMNVRYIFMMFSFCITLMYLLKYYQYKGKGNKFTYDQQMLV